MGGSQPFSPDGTAKADVSFYLFVLLAVLSVRPGKAQVQGEEREGRSRRQEGQGGGEAGDAVRAWCRPQSS